MQTLLHDVPEHNGKLSMFYIMMMKMIWTNILKITKEEIAKLKTTSLK